MPITKGQFGKHENVTVIEFGTGDINMVKMREIEDSHESMVAFRINKEPRQIGQEDNDFAGKVSDDLPSINTIFKFTKPESITAIIHTLIEVQQSMYGKK